MLFWLGNMKKRCVCTAITPENVDNPTHTRSPIDESVATVNSEGLVSGMGEGDVLITVTVRIGV